MEAGYSEWKTVTDAYNRRKILYCPYCGDHRAYLKMRYATDREGNTEKQYRVECPVCEHKGKTYLHEKIAEQSWSARENDPAPRFSPEIRRRYR